MVQVIQSTFLQALGTALISSLWQFALLWLVYAALHAVCKLSGNQKYSLGFLLQLTGFGWFVSTFYFHCLQTEVTGAAVLQAKGETFIAAGGNAAQVFFDSLTRLQQYLPWLSLLYIALLSFFCLRWLRAYRYTQSVRTNGLQKADVKLRLFVKQICGQMQIKRSVAIYLSGIVTAPLTIGFFKPLILIPIASVNQLTTEQMEAVILHELAHIKRCDYVFNLCLALIEVTLFFNPFMHLISRHIKKERENCCDDWVLQYEYNAASYAHALLKIATFQSSFPALTLQAAGDKQQLLNRIKRMIEKKEKTLFYYRYQVSALLIITVVFGSLALFSPARRTNKADIVSLQPQAYNLLAANENKSLFLLPQPNKETLLRNSEMNKLSLENQTAMAHPFPPAHPIPFMGKRERKALLPPPVLPAMPPGAVLAADASAENAFNSLRGQNERVDFEISDVSSAPAAEAVRSAERKVKGLIAILLKEKINAAAQQAGQQQSKAAMEQVVQKLQSQVDKVFSFSYHFNTNELLKKQAALKNIPSPLNASQLHLLAEQLKKAVDEIKEQSAAAASADENFNIQMPEFDYTVPLNENDIINGEEIAPASKPCLPSKAINAKKKTKSVVIFNSDENGATLRAETAPAEGEKVRERAVNVHTNMRIIKI